MTVLHWLERPVQIVPGAPYPTRRARVWSVGAVVKLLKASDVSPCTGKARKSEQARVGSVESSSTVPAAPVGMSERVTAAAGVAGVECLDEHPQNRTSAVKLNCFSIVQTRGVT